MSGAGPRGGSMNLLTDLMDKPLDPGYAHVAQRRRDGGDGEGRRGPNAVVIALAAVIVGALFAAAVVDLRLPGRDDARTVLVDEITSRTEEADASAVRVEQLRAEVGALESQALAGGQTGVLETSRRLGVVAGALPVEGPGLVVTLDDATGADPPFGDGDPRDPGPADNRVVDLDVQIAVNGLWAAGAEAVAVNRQRLTSLSAIRWAGGAVLVGFRPLDRPYTIRAVGDPAELETRLAESSAGSYLAFIREQYGLTVSVERSDALELPGAGSLRLQYAEATGSPVDDTMEDQEVIQ